ncbi:hypothetical protein NHX12_027153 [Muraenolepis orangiensis]|uniref:Ion transport domain-containing protein n=1 Tax=Muraenolepis orangiensis TaxID=630683 RepID=A0A9Q0EGF3_9TELE|nr:hypothetical protein NHX12_027153 [Muraenolepis orangiensis]
MILSNMIRFLLVYVVFLFGFSAAIVALMDENPPDGMKTNNSSPTYSNIQSTTLELFKLTIGMGELAFTDHLEYIEVFYFLLIAYLVLTYILLLNMLIALMSETVERVSRESESIWRLQRSLTILDLERALPWCLRRQLQSGITKTMTLVRGQDSRTFFRVEEVNWQKWWSNLAIMREEEEIEVEQEPMSIAAQQPRNLWNIRPHLARLRGRRTSGPHTVI